MEQEQNKVKIAIADDHDLFRVGMASILKGYDQFDVMLEAGDGKELLTKIKEVQELPDILLLDIRMPEMDGFEVTEELTKNYPSIKIIVLSMHDKARYIVRMIELGANGYLFKNARPEEVVESIEMVMEQDYYFNARINSLLQRIIRYKGKNFQDADDEIPVQISGREQEVLELICKEHTTAEMADILCLSTRTIEGHRKNLIAKFNVRNVAGLVVYAFKHELIELGK